MTDKKDPQGLINDIENLLYEVRSVAELSSRAADKYGDEMASCLGGAWLITEGLTREVFAKAEELAELAESSSSQAVEEGQGHE